MPRAPARAGAVQAAAPPAGARPGSGATTAPAATALNRSLRLAIALHRVRPEGVADEAAGGVDAEQAGVEVFGEGLPVVGSKRVVDVQARRVQPHPQRDL